MFRSGGHIFKWTFIYKFVIDKIMVLIGIIRAKKLDSFYNQFISWSSNKDNFSFALTAAMTNFIFKVAICTLRHILNIKDAAQTKHLYAISAFLGGLSLRIYEKGKWTNIMTHWFIAMTIDTILNKLF